MPSSSPKKRLRHSSPPPPSSTPSPASSASSSAFSLLRNDAPPPPPPLIFNLPAASTVQQVTFEARFAAFVTDLRSSCPASPDVAVVSPPPEDVLSRAFDVLCDGYESLGFSIPTATTPVRVVVRTAVSNFSNIVGPLWSYAQNDLRLRLEEETQRGVRLGQQLQEEKQRGVRLDQQLQEEKQRGIELNQQLQEEMQRGVRLNQQLKEEMQRGVRLNQQLQEETQRGVRLDQQLQEETQRSIRLDQQLQEETQRGARLDQQLQEETQRSIRLDQQLFDIQTTNTTLAAKLESQSERAAKLGEHLNGREAIHLSEKRYLREKIASEKENRQQEKATHQSLVDSLTDSRDRANSMVLYLRNRLEKLAEAPTHPVGSATRAATWQVVTIAPSTRMDQPLPLTDLPALDSRSEVTMNRLDKRKFVTELEMYVPVVNALNKVFGNAGSSLRAHNTHQSHYLDGYAPDITIVRDAKSSIDASSVCAVLEMKNEQLDASGLGQVYDYVLAQRNNQPNRRYIVSVLSNIHNNTVLVLDKDRVTHYTSVGCGDLARFLLHFLSHPAWQPPVSVFSSDLGSYEQRLGRPTHSIVASFPIPATLCLDHQPAPPASEVKSFASFRTVFPATQPSPLMAVKRALHQSTKLDDEVKALRLVLERGGHPQLPQLLYFTNDLMELATAPVGRPLSRGDPAAHVAGVLEDVLDGLEWMHQQNVVHRDVRWENIVVVKQASSSDRPRGVLIDLGEAFIIDPAVPRSASMRGGYVCIPPKYLDDPLHAFYRPEPKHDYLSFVILVNVLLFPDSWGHLRTQNICFKESDENQRLREFWLAVDRSEFWKQYRQAAENSQVAALKKLLQICVWC